MLATSVLDVAPVVASLFPAGEPAPPGFRKDVTSLISTPGGLRT